MTKNNLGWKIRAASANDIQKIRTLFYEVWGYNRPEAYDVWRYFGGSRNMCPVTLAMDGEKVVGSYSLWPTLIKVGETVISGGQSMDTMTHPDYQGQGIFIKLAEACYELAISQGIKLIYGFPNPLSYPGFTKRLGWTHVGDMTHWVRLIKPSKHPKIPAVIGRAADFATRFIPLNNLSKYEIKVGMPRPIDLKALLANWNSKLNYCQIDRNIEWLNWRYSDSAENDYEWISICKQGYVIGACVWGMKNTNWGEIGDNRAHLVELFGMDREGVSKILAAAIRAAEQKGAVLLETVCGRNLSAKHLILAGFYSHRKAPFIVKRLLNNSNDKDIYDIKKWNIVGGDLDTF